MILHKPEAQCDDKYERKKQNQGHIKQRLLAHRRRIPVLHAVILLLGLLMIPAAVSAAPWIACRTEGATYRLIDGRRCWTDQHHSKSALYWPKRKARIVDMRDVPMPVEQPVEETIEPPKYMLVHELVDRLHTAQLETDPRIEPGGAPEPVALASPTLPADVIPLPRPRPHIEEPPQRPIFAPHWGLLLALLLIGNAVVEDCDGTRHDYRLG